MDTRITHGKAVNMIRRIAVTRANRLPKIPTTKEITTDQYDAVKTVHVEKAIDCFLKNVDGIPRAMLIEDVFEGIRDRMGYGDDEAE